MSLMDLAGPPQADASPPPPPAPSPLPGVSPVSSPSAPSPEAVAPRLDYLANNHAWMDPSLMMATATAPISDGDVVATAQYFKGVLTNAWDGWDSLFKDPVLAKRPSTGLVIKRFFDNTLGPYPVAGEDLHQGQTQLQKFGFGQTLPADGIWSPQWNSAYRQYVNSISSEQLAGKRPGGTTVGNAVRSILGSFLPKKAADAIVGMVASTPHSIRQLAADLTMAIATPVDLIHGGPRLADTAGGFVMGQTPQQFAQDLMGGTVIGFDAHGIPQYAPGTGPNFGRVALRALGDAGTVMLLGDSFNATSSISRAAGSAFKAKAFGLVPDLTYSEAARGPGVIANSMASAGRAAFATPIRGAVAGAGVGAVAAGLTGNNPLEGASVGAGAGALFGSDVFEQIPAIGKTGAVLGRLAGQAEDDPGLYYKARTLMRQPYRLPAVRAAGDIVGTAGVLGAKARGLAALTPGSELAKAIQQDRTGETVDAFLHRVTAPVFNNKFSLGLDDLAFLLHPSELAGGETVSQKVGAHTSAAVDAISHSLGDTGAIAQAELATGKTWGELIKTFGGEDRAYIWLADHVKDHAAWANAEEALAALGDQAPVNETARVKFLQDYAAATRADPDKLDPAIERLLSNPGELQGRIGHQMTNAAIAAGRNPSELPLPGTDFFDAVEHVRDHLLEFEPQFRLRGFMLSEHNEPSPDPFGGVDETVPAAPKQLGLMKAALRDRQQLEQAIADLRTEAESAGDNPEAAITADHHVAEFLHQNFGVVAAKMPGSVAAKLDQAEEMAKAVATRIYATPDMPDNVKAAIQSIRELGYKVVAGTDTGHIFTEEGDAPWVNGPLTYRRRLVAALGLNPDRIDTRSISRVRSDGVRMAVQQAVNDGKITMPPLTTPDSLISHVFDHVAKDSSGYLQDVAMSLARGTRRGAIKAIAEAEGMSGDAALGLLKQEFNEGAYFDVRDIPRSKVVEALTQPRNLDAQIVTALEQKHQLPFGSLLNDVPLMTKGEANAFYRAAVQGASAPPAFMLGASKIEDLARAGMGMVGDKLAPQWLRDTSAYSSAVNLPNRMVQLRNQLRFSLDPYFSFRRVTKINAKLGLEGIAPTVFPLQKMVDNGTFNDARALLEELHPAIRNTASEFSDAADRYLHSNDVFGFYDGRNYERYAAIEAQRQGMSNDQIKALLTKTFGYGTSAGEGRSAAERTTNFIFFPFSFDKTLYRNVGGYLLDHPAQQILIDRGLRAYKKFNDEHLDGSDPLAASWYERHLPILAEAQHLNAFAYGLSLGQPVGLNLPLLNMFIPQNWEGSAHALATVKQFVPALRDFSRVMGEAQDQGQVAYAGVHNSIDDIMNGQPADRKMLWQQPSAEGKYAQFTDAFQMRAALGAHFANSIAYNATRKPGSQVTFNNPVYGKWNGLPITKTIIDQIVQSRFPQYSPVDAASFAASQSDALVKYRVSLQGTPNAARYDHLLDVMSSAASVIKDAKSWTPKVEAQVTDEVRRSAMYYAEHDPAFYAMYQKHFASIYGPLEKVQG